MIDDFRILGIAETRDPRLVKEAFRARAKELHPDAVIAKGGSEDDPMKRHLLFIALNQAYRRVLASIAASSSGPEKGADLEAEAARRAAARGPARPSGADASGGAIAPHKDPAYVLYKTGMRFFMAIHPSAWDLGPRVLSDDPSGSETVDAEMRAKVSELVRLFPKAYYYFGLVVAEHPDSPWAADARDKMDVIERRTARYKKILESFGAWRRAGRERGREVTGIVGRTKKLMEDEGELRWPKG